MPARPRPRRRRERGAEQADRDGSEAALELDEAAEHGLGAELVLVARIDAGEEGSDQPRDRFVSEAPAGEGRHRFAGGVAAKAQRLGEQAQLAARREQARAREPERRERNRQQLAVAIHEPEPARRLRGLQRLAQADAIEQAQQRRLDLDRAWPALDHVARDVVRAHHAARPVAGVDHEDLAQALLQLEAGREARDPGPHHHRADVRRRHQTVRLKIGRPERCCSGR